MDLRVGWENIMSNFYNLIAPWVQAVAALLKCGPVYPGEYFQCPCVSFHKMLYKVFLCGNVSYFFEVMSCDYPAIMN